MNSCINLPYGLSKSEKDKFKRQYWFIEIYEDSVDGNYIQILKDSQYKMVISPWHDKDVAEDGKIKKKHRHILIDFGGSVRTKQVCDLANSIKAKNDVMYVGSKISAFDYLTHKNDPDKYQYDVSEIVFINSKVYDWKKSEFREILDYIDENKIISLKQLTKYLRKDNNDNLLKYVSNNSYYICQYLKDSKEDLCYNMSILIQYVNQCINEYEIDKIIKSESIKAVNSKLEEIGFEGLDFKMSE